MARYIDADALTAEFKRLTLGENSLIERIFADGVYAVIDTFPAADVVPKSELEQLKHKYDLAVAERVANIEGFTEQLSRSKADVAREIFAEIYEDCFDQFGYFDYDAFIQLKKKYTGGE
jgi:hypothetical protein